MDVHQHLWTEPLLDALARRHSRPFVASTDGQRVLHCAGERPYVVDVAADTPGHRERLLVADGIDGALVALSSPIGIESLPRESAESLIDAHLDGVASAGGRFRAWGPLPLDRCQPDDVDGVIARGCAGVSLPASALADANRLHALGPVLERIEATDAVLFVHPGPVRGGDAPSEPLWWPALTAYVAQMQAAWLAFATLGRREHPRLRVIFALLAGLAPLLAERLRTRGGPALDLRDPGVFYDTSSHGAEAIGALSLRVGAAQIVYGTDRPVLDPLATSRDTLFQANAAALMGAKRSIR